jgi:DNA-directed RNA polymerase subunit H (RpoH/RPB5)
LSKKEQAPNHQLIPAHRILSAEEKVKVLQKLGIGEMDLPKIHANDPAIISLGAKFGELIHIKRIEATGESDYYRVVVRV